MKSKKTRINNKRPNFLRRRALRVNQDAEHPLYMFTLTGDELTQIADISRVSRDEQGKLIGYQRPEVKRHIQNIKDYLESGDVVFPNSVILALSSDVEFTKSRGPKVEGFAVAGVLKIHLPRDGEPKPAWIVDGQQRTIALTQSKRKDFPVPVNAFIADNVDLQRDQFLRINSTKPLPRGLIDELLPEVTTTLPSNLAARKVPSALCDMLNQDPESPFHELIRRASTSKAKKRTAVVADTVVTKMIHDSFALHSGALFPFRDVASNSTDFAGIKSMLFVYWKAVRDVFPEAWGLPPEKSRLMHGVGIRAMGRLMDRVMLMIDPEHPKAYARVRRELELIRPVCHWTEGTWDGLNGLPWNELENTAKHHKALSNLLIRTYIGARKAA